MSARGWAILSLVLVAAMALSFVMWFQQNYACASPSGYTSGNYCGILPFLAGMTLLLFAAGAGWISVSRQPIHPIERTRWPSALVGLGSEGVGVALFLVGRGNAIFAFSGFLLFVMGVPLVAVSRLRPIVEDP